MKNLPAVDHTISKEMADALKQNFITKHETDGIIATRAHHFHADQVKTLVDDPNIKTFTISNGYDLEKEAEVPVLEGFDSEGNSLGIFLEISWPCPPYCSDGAELPKAQE